MTIPQHLLDAAAQHVQRGRRAGLMVRHAERHPVRNLLKHELVLLTENGHEQAKLAKSLLRASNRAEQSDVAFGAEFSHLPDDSPPFGTGTSS